MKLKITKDANGTYRLYRVDTVYGGLFPRKENTFLESSKNAVRVLDRMRSILGSNIENGLLDVECVEEEA